MAQRHTPAKNEYIRKYGNTASVTQNRRATSTNTAHRTKTTPHPPAIFPQKGDLRKNSSRESNGHHSYHLTKPPLVKSTKTTEAIHLALDALGMAPGPVGPAADLTNAVLYFSEGRTKDGVISLICSVPAIGDSFSIASKSGKITEKAAKFIKNEEKLAEFSKLGKVGLKKAAEKAVKEEGLQLGEKIGEQAVKAGKLQTLFSKSEGKAFTRIASKAAREAVAEEKATKTTLKITKAVGKTAEKEAGKAAESGIRATKDFSATFKNFFATGSARSEQKAFRKISSNVAKEVSVEEKVANTALKTAKTGERVAATNTASKSVVKPTEITVEKETVKNVALGINSDTKLLQNVLPNVEKATINPNKLTGYALNPEHPVGSNKAKVFESALGYNQSNASGLTKQIYEKLSQNDATLGKLDKYGQRYTVDIPITGPNGNTVNVRTGWIVKTGSDTPELTTIFVKQ